MNIYFCGDIMRACEVLKKAEGLICIDVDMPGIEHVPGIAAVYKTTPERSVCEFENGEIPLQGIDTIIINRFSLAVLGGVLAACEMKPEDKEFWHTVANYTPSHFETLHQYPEGLPKFQVDRIRAFDFDLNIFRGTINAKNQSDLMPQFFSAQERLHYVLEQDETMVHKLAEERVDHMEKEWQGLGARNEKEFTR